MNDKTNAIIERYLEAYNAFDMEGMAQLLHEDIVFRNFHNGEQNAETQGVQAFRELAEKSAALFSSRRQQAVHYRDTDGSIEVEIDYTAVLAADLPNGMKAGDQLRLKGTSVFDLRDGKILRIEDYS
ncbi:nuclear transport factor 2 family protein [Paenibacillus methanolicus]|uniref:Ketosteroid isomerase-like protein n=1 Tax=Paenibacillus methanolicus TaxID=582686 RepID=A0A5S5C597_9BACL|nr:nuclear transport factor 2 family protein [Paenibacillus methanolicus]TYP74611.1 ketosteroid isomerase-like protein [Paenibacillus methanolicus]